MNQKPSELGSNRADEFEADFLRPHLLSSRDPETSSNVVSALLNSMPIPTLIVSNDLRVMWTSATLRRLLKADESKHGEQISAFAGQASESLEPLLRDSLELLEPREMNLQVSDGRWFEMRARPYRTHENKIQGLIITFSDIDEMLQHSVSLLQQRDTAQAVLNHVPISVVIVDSQCRVMALNPAFTNLTNLKSAEVEGKSFPDLVRYLWGEMDMADRLSMLQASREGSSFVWEHASTDGKRLTFKGDSAVIDEKQISLIFIEDVTQSHQRQQQSAQQAASLAEEAESTLTRLQKTEEELQRLTSHLFQAQEEEQQRVARELHDDIGQRLSLTALKLQGMQLSANGMRRQADITELDNVSRSLDQLSTDVRNTSHRLHPAVLAELGLPAALKSLLEDFGKSEGVPVTFSSSDLPETINSVTSLSAYRIAQEALRNVSKYAGKTHTRITLQGKENVLILEIRDSGHGFDQDYQAGSVQSGLGFVSMKERARQTNGKLTVSSELGVGTTVKAELGLK